MDPMLAQILGGGGQPMSAQGVKGNIGQALPPMGFGAQLNQPPNLNGVMAQLQASHPAMAPQTQAPLGFGGFNAASHLKDITDRNSAFVNNAAAHSGQANASPIFQQYQGLMDSYQNNLNTPGYTEDPSAFLRRQAAEDPNSWGFLLNLLGGGGGNTPSPAQGQAQTAPLGAPASQGQGPQDWQAFFNSRPDLMADYQGNLDRWAGTGKYTETPEQYLRRQYAEHGRNEGWNVALG